MQYPFRTWRLAVVFLVAGSFSACDMEGEHTASPTAKPVSDEQPEATTGWKLLETKDPITDQITRSAGISAEEHDDLVFSVMCYEEPRLPTVFVLFEKYNPMPISKVIYRIDQSEPVEETWFVSKKLYARPYGDQADIDDLINQLSTAEKIVIRTKPVDASVSSETLTFSMKGIDKAFDHVLGAGACMKEASST